MIRVTAKIVIRQKDTFNSLYLAYIMDFPVLPNIGDDINDRGLEYVVEHRVFHTGRGLISIYLEDIDAPTKNDFERLKELMKERDWVEVE